MKIRNQEVDVDVKAELENFHFDRVIWETSKMRSCSPFRSERKPSFFVRLRDGDGYEAGMWHDSGGINFTSGTFPTLLAFLREEELEDTENYLLETYGGEVGYQHLELRLDFDEDNRYSLLDPLLLSQYEKDYTYLSNRGITQSVQELCQIHYDEKNDSVVIPWFDSKGNLAKIKYRKTKSKHFHYSKDGIPIRDLIWGLNIIYARNIDYAVITESETDSMTLLSNGIPSVALGGATIGDKKRDLLIKSPLKRIYIATDNDETGNRIRRQLISKLAPYKQLFTCNIPRIYKDVNDIPTSYEIKNLVNNASKVDSLFVKF